MLGGDDVQRVDACGHEHEFDDGVYSGPSGIVLLPEKARDLRGDLGTLLSALTNANSKTLNFKSGLGEEAYRLQLVALAEAVENFNELLSPVLARRRRPDGTSTPSGGCVEQRP